MYVALTNDGGFYAAKDEDEAVEMSEHWESDFDDWSYNVFEVNGADMYFTGLDFTWEYVAREERELWVAAIKKWIPASEHVIELIVRDVESEARLPGV